MQRQMIGSHSVVLYCTRKELRRKGVSLQGIDLGQILALVREGLAEWGIPPERAEEIEVHTERRGLLMFVLLREEEEQVYRFASLSDLLDAVSVLREPPEHEIMQGRGGGWLLRSGREGALLSEFGTAAEAEEEAVMVLEREEAERLWNILRKG